MDEGIFLPIILWAVLSLSLLFRKSLSVAARLASIAILLIYVALFYEDILKLQNFASLDYLSILKNTIKLAMTSLVWVWPVSLFYVAFASQDKDASVFMNILFGLSAVVWALYFVIL